MFNEAKETMKEAGGFIKECTDEIITLRAINAELLEALEHAVNWSKGYGFPEDHKPVWMPNAEEAIRKAKS